MAGTTPTSPSPSPARDTGAVQSGIATDSVAGATVTSEGSRPVRHQQRRLRRQRRQRRASGNGRRHQHRQDRPADQRQPRSGGERQWLEQHRRHRLLHLCRHRRRSVRHRDRHRRRRHPYRRGRRSVRHQQRRLRRQRRQRRLVCNGRRHQHRQDQPAGQRQPRPRGNTNGWNNTDVTVSFTCADTGAVQSGIATDTVAGDTVTAKAQASPSPTAAPASTTPGTAPRLRSVGDINIDKTNPQISGSRDPDANTNGWNNTDVTVSFTCADAGVVQSGIASDTVAGDTVTSEGADQSVTNSGVCVDNAGNAASSATVGGINIDKTAPQISGSRDPEANGNGWNNSDVTVSFTCDDTGAVQSGIATDTVAGDTVTFEGADQSVINSGACVDNAGNAASYTSVGGINIDKTNPQINGSRDPEANGNGWNNTDVAVSFACADSGVAQSGIATDTVAGDTVTAEGADQSVTNSGFCVDNAGNAASSETFGGINIDKTDPRVSGSRSPDPNSNGWNNSDVAVSFTCADSGAVQSGIATDTVAGDTVTSEGADQSVTNSGACVDNAGNAASSTSVGDINIDKTNPQITGSRDPGANANGWNNTDVTVSFTCADSGDVQSGIATDTVAGDTVTSEGTDQSATNSGVCVDNAGNVALSATVSDINIDKTAPQIGGSRSPARQHQRLEQHRCHRLLHLRRHGRRSVRHRDRQRRRRNRHRRRCRPVRHQ